MKTLGRVIKKCIDAGLEIEIFRHPHSKIVSVRVLDRTGEQLRGCERLTADELFNRAPDGSLCFAIEAAQRDVKP
jgi:hypothetical protein